jgi:hypothetical protein
VANSQNGWPVAAAAQQDRGPLIRNVTVPNGVLAGDVATVFRWLAGQYDAQVERLKDGSCWGWFVKPIEGGTSFSNHASGTAVDFNADEHPMGQQPSFSFSHAQIIACRGIVKAAGGVLRWGGDYTGRKDGMHWEIIGTRSQVAALAAKIRKPPEDVVDIDGYFKQTTSSDGGLESSAGHVLLTQAVPNGLDPDLKREPAWKVLTDLGVAVRELTAKVDALTPPA